MQNLAVRNPTEEQIRLNSEAIEKELREAKVNLCNEPVPHGEPHSRISGWLGEFHFTRSWRYWVVTGKVPLVVAQELYSTELGKKDVRVAGHCGCPAPEDPWIEYYSDKGRPIHTLKEKAEMEKFVNQEDSSFRIVAQRFLRDNDFADDRANIPGVKMYVESYHIDSQEGLNYLVETLRKHDKNLFDAPTMDPKNLCNRGACKAPGAICWNQTMHAWYCISCARKINQASVEMTHNFSNGPLDKLISIPDEDNGNRILRRGKYATCQTT